MPTRSMNFHHLPHATRENGIISGLLSPSEEALSGTERSVCPSVQIQVQLSKARRGFPQAPCQPFPAAWYAALRTVSSFSGEKSIRTVLTRSREKFPGFDRPN